MREEVFTIHLSWWQRIKVLWDGNLIITVENPEHINTKFMGIE